MATFYTLDSTCRMSPPRVGRAPRTVRPLHAPRENLRGVIRASPCIKNCLGRKSGINQVELPFLNRTPLYRTDGPPLLLEDLIFNLPFEWSVTLFKLGRTAAQWPSRHLSANARMVRSKDQGTCYGQFPRYNNPHETSPPRISCRVPSVTNATIVCP
jgi:hypothetical protein